MKTATSLFACPCCGLRTLDERYRYEICPVCWWEDDGQDNQNANEILGGPNGQLSLTRGRINYLIYGISQPHRTDLRRHQERPDRYMPGRHFVLIDNGAAVAEPAVGWRSSPALRLNLQPFKLERYFAQHEFSAPYLLCSSDCESLTVRDLLAFEADAAERLAGLWLGYTEAPGDPALRQAIAGLYDAMTADQILVHAGAEEAIFNFMNVTLQPGDHVIVHMPCYQSLAEVARSIGAEVAGWPGDPDRGWALELDDLRALLTARTRLVVVNFPHNPTGFLPDHDFVRELAELSARHGFLLFSDEVYRGLELDPADRLPPLADLDDRAVSLGVMSKSYGLAGLRIGWIATRNRELYAAMAAFKDYTSICNSAPSEFLATLALRHAGPIVDRNLAIIRTNLAHLDAFFSRYADRFQWQRPRAGSVAFPTLLQDDAELFCAELVEQAGVLLLPGTLYSPAFNAVRIGFGRKNLPAALDRLERFLQNTEEKPAVA